MARSAIRTARRSIAANAGLDRSVAVEKVRNLPEGQGLNAAVPVLRTDVASIHGQSDGGFALALASRRSSSTV